MCYGPVWGSLGGWGMPWIMFLVPVLFLVAIFLACRSFRPRFAGWCEYRPLVDGNSAEEVRKLRQEVDELRREYNAPK